MENGLDMNDNAADDHLEFYNLFKDFHHTMVDWFRNDTIYNLNGMKVSGPLKKGIYIKNGKKIVIK